MAESSKIYRPVELEILLKIHKASYRTVLPIILAIFRHISAHPNSRANEIDIIHDIETDIDLQDAGCMIRDETLIRDAIKNLVDQSFLARRNGEIILTDCGKKAVEILKF